MSFRSRCEFFLGRPAAEFLCNFVVYWIKIWVLEPQLSSNKRECLLFQKSQMGDTDTEAVRAHCGNT